MDKPQKESCASYIFVELGASALRDGQWFDALTTGEFVDMWSQDVIVAADELDEYVDNTLAAILATETASGEIVGLPIDAENHDRGQAAGWIIDIERVDDMLRVLPRWTEIGVDLISKGAMRFFSATFVPKKKVILGGTLTNWPGSRNDKEEILLKPIELSKNVWAYKKEIEPPKKKVILGGTLTNWPGSRNDREEILLKPIELSKNVWAYKKEIEPPKIKGAKMVDFTELTDEQKSELMGQAEEKLLADLVPAQGDEESDDKIAQLRERLDLSAFSEIANIDGISDALNAQMEAILLDNLNRIEAQAGRRMAQLMSEMKQKSEVADFCARVTGGDEELPYGLPIQGDELETFMLGLDKPQRAAASSFFDRILASGLTEFSEAGHGREIQGTQELPAGVDRLLRQHLSRGGEMFTFFEAAEIGDMGQYNLAAYKEKENG